MFEESVREASVISLAISGSSKVGASTVSGSNVRLSWLSSFATLIYRLGLVSGRQKYPNVNPKSVIVALHKQGRKYGKVFKNSIPPKISG